MRILSLALATALISGSALAQTPAANPNPSTPAVTTPGTNNAGAPVAGANSFTEAQAKDLIEKAGFADVTDLKLDDKGVWQASATKDGKPAKVSLDYQGNIVTM